MTRVSGEFDVKLTPQAADEGGEAAIGRLAIVKTFRGGLDGTSKGQMLAFAGDVKESAGYVAMERVTGSLGGHAGSFVLQHSGTMNRGKPSLIITIVPDSGAGGLAGIAGTMTITITDGKHLYDLDYTLTP